MAYLSQMFIKITSVTRRKNRLENKTPYYLLGLHPFFLLFSLILSGKEFQLYYFDLQSPRIKISLRIVEVFSIFLRFKEVLYQQASDGVVKENGKSCEIFEILSFNLFQQSSFAKDDDLF